MAKKIKQEKKPYLVNEEEFKNTIKKFFKLQLLLKRKRSLSELVSVGLYVLRLQWRRE